MMVSLVLRLESVEFYPSVQIFLCLLQQPVSGWSQLKLGVVSVIKCIPA